MKRLSRSTPILLAAVLAYSLTAFLPVNASTAIEHEWHFKVYLDNKAIGHHYFRVTREGKHEQLDTRADFDVTFLKLPFFTYRHENTELWYDQCLKSIASTTDQNGDLFSVQGTTNERGFHLVTRDSETTLPACISTFAYWDKSFLQNDRLLNSQTGEYLDVDVEELGEKSIRVRNRNVSANHYKLTAEALDIDLWYSGDDQWLALQSTTSKGRVLRYVIE